MFTLAMVSLPAYSAPISSRAGAIALHGPHHSAQKSTSTAPLAPSTSVLKLASVTALVFSLISGSPSISMAAELGVFGPSIKPTRLRPEHAGPAANREVA